MQYRENSILRLFSIGFVEEVGKVFLSCGLLGKTRNAWSTQRGEKTNHFGAWENEKGFIKVNPAFIRNHEAYPIFSMEASDGFNFQMLVP
ncbi:hypothetical protein NPIL_393951 [Nephila pilipes]|uniref:Uncharacterized protein n=1 Tax=Nephila pilipes TaxID=299642 RepID=A0A8X6QH63_NEPPI|nr:hypothetical protein NPIL_393951 [Nephila pilipes]